MKPSTFAGVVAGIGFFLAAAGVARAGEIQGAVGGGGILSDWRGDGGVGSSLRIGYRFADLIAIDALTRLGYSTVDKRVITYLSLGSTIYAKIGPLRPYGRLALVHQHEEPTTAVKEDPFGALFGVGDGIRHRGGFGAGLGADLPFRRDGSLEWTVGADLTGTYLPDPRGPRWYAMLGLYIGANYTL
jgi:hypothetical protein